MALKLFNTLAREVQEFTPLDPAGKKVSMYCCGPTVYDFAHIGNWRTFVFADLVRRYLQFKSYEVNHVMNITDVEDKIIKRVRETKTSLREFTGKYEAAFLEDLKALNCLEPHHKPRATEHIPEIISLIEKLLARGVAYKAGDSSVYFSIEKYRGCGCNYGQLVKLNFDELRVGERVASDEYDKESLADFALWKARVPEDGEVFWPSPFGEGRPGWHIECSAMSMKVLGESFDLHLGGEDLKFPHHEDEIAQSEGATGKPFVKHWMHGAFLLVEGKKMSKSLGNFFTLRDLLAKGFKGPEIRYLLLTAHYRETFNFTLEGLHGAKTALARIDECIGKLREIAAGAPPTDTNGQLVANFTAALDDDLNISAAWAAVFEWVKRMNIWYCLEEEGRAIDSKQSKVSKQIATYDVTRATEAATELAAWNRVNSVLGLSKQTKSGLVNFSMVKPEDDWIGDQEIIKLVLARSEAKKAKDFKRSDAIRDELKSKGWIVEDSPKGPKLKKL
jgi:cysteinyl-tRNA synthetase